MSTLDDFGITWVGLAFIAYVLVTNWHVLGWIWAQRRTGSRSGTKEGPAEPGGKDHHADTH